MKKEEAEEEEGAFLAFFPTPTSFFYSPLFLRGL